MSEIAKLDDIATIDDSYDKLKQTGLFYQKKTVESLLSFSIVVNVLQTKCKEDETTDFNNLCLEYWGLSASGASQTAKIGANVSTLSQYTDKLPPSSRALYELTSLKPKQLAESIEDGLITPSTTVTEAKSLKLGIKEEKQPTKLSENPFAVEATKDEKVIEAELLPAEDTASDDTDVIEKPKRKKMTAVEAIDYLEINVKAHYEAVIKAGLTPLELLDEAYGILTGKKKKKENSQA